MDLARRCQRDLTQGMLWLCLVVSVGTVGSLTPQSDLWAAANAEVAHGTEIHASANHPSEAADGHAAGGHGEHNPFDLTHSNAGKDQADPAALPKSDLAIWTFVVFALLLVVLRKFAWAPIMDSLHKREHFVESQLQQAKESNEQAQRLLTDHQQKLTQAQEEIRQMMELARKDAETHRQQVVAEADQAAQGHKNRALQAIEAAKNSALSELAERSVDTAVGLAGKIVRRQLNRNDHADLVQDALANFPGQN